MHLSCQAIYVFRLDSSLVWQGISLTNPLLFIVWQIFAYHLLTLLSLIIVFFLWEYLEQGYFVLEPWSTTRLNNSDLFFTIDWVNEEMIHFYCWILKHKSPRSLFPLELAFIVLQVPSYTCVPMFYFHWHVNFIRIVPLQKLSYCPGNLDASLSVLLLFIYHVLFQNDLPISSLYF